MKKVFKKYLDIHSRGKSDKNGIFDVMMSYSIFDKYTAQQKFSTEKLIFISANGLKL